jgi:hypothetical protein
LKFTPENSNLFTSTVLAPPDELELLEDELLLPPLLDEELELLELLEDEEEELEELDFPPLLEEELELELELLDELDELEVLELLGTAATAVLTCSVAASDTFPEVSRARTVTV